MQQSEWRTWYSANVEKRSRVHTVARRFVRTMYAGLTANADGHPSYGMATREEWSAPGRTRTRNLQIRNLWGPPASADQPCTAAPSHARA